MSKTLRTYRFQMRVVLGAPHYTTVNAEPVEIEAFNAHSADQAARRVTLKQNPDAREVYAASRRVVAKRTVEF